MAASTELSRHVDGYTQCRNRTRYETTNGLVVVIVFLYNQ